jgi:hypothetical protein
MKDRPNPSRCVGKLFQRITSEKGKGAAQDSQAGSRVSPVRIASAEAKYEKGDWMGAFAEYTALFGELVQGIACGTTHPTDFYRVTDRYADLAVLLGFVPASLGAYQTVRDGAQSADMQLRAGTKLLQLAAESGYPHRCKEALRWLSDRLDGLVCIAVSDEHIQNWEKAFRLESPQLAGLLPNLYLALGKRTTPFTGWTNPGYG